MSQSANQRYLEPILEAMRLIIADGRLTYGDAIYILMGLLNIDWQKDDEVLTDQPELPMTHKVTEPGRHSGVPVSSWLK